MVLAQFKFVRNNSKFIIIGAMVFGALYPFFANAELPVVKDPKYVSIAVLIAAIVVFWELYGQGKSSSQQAFPRRYPSEYGVPPYPSYGEGQHSSQGVTRGLPAEFARTARPPMQQAPPPSPPVQQIPPRSYQPRQQYPAPNQQPYQYQQNIM